MDLNILNPEDDIKLVFEPTTSICRCCLSTEKRMFSCESITSYLDELIGLNVQSFDSLPLQICYECNAYLMKSIKFKHRVIKAHGILYEYVTRCAPFPIDAQDPELNKYASPILRRTSVLSIETTGKGRVGYHKVFTHKKDTSHTELDVDTDLLPTTSAVKSEENVKEELGYSDCDDDIPLEEISANIRETNDEGNISGIKVENSEKVNSNKKHTKKKAVVKVKKKTRIQSEHNYSEEKRPSVRRSIELDPTKIRVIRLNPEEQIKMREEESKESHKFPYQCELCFKGFNFETKLAKHMQKHDPSRGPYECKTCKMYLPTPYSYSVHRLIHTQRYECVKCNRRMIDKASILDHYRSQHEGLTSLYTCTKCGKISNNSKTHRGHMRNRHGESRPKCEQCGKTFVNQDSLDCHMQIHAGVKNYECAVCGARFRTRSQIKHHHLRHSDERTYYCVECDARFKTAQSLKMHLKKSTKHIDLESLRYPCLRCEKRFDTESSLTHHNLVQHEGFRGHRCGECGAALATANSLSKHIASVHKGHKSEAKHVCDTCGKAFRGRSVLVNHVRTHTGEKPFECNVCGRKFSQKTAMMTHVKFIHMKLRRQAKVKPEISSETREWAAQPHMFTKEENPPICDTWRESANCDVFYHIEAT